MVPAVELPPETPFTLQVTPVFDVPVTVAVNCCVLPSNTLELDDETVTVTDWDGGGRDVDELTPPHPTRPPATANKRMTKKDLLSEKNSRAECPPRGFITFLIILLLGPKKVHRGPSVH
jgi:hypothetical protein